jgi:hypothetical protein
LKGKGEKMENKKRKTPCDIIEETYRMSQELKRLEKEEKQVIKLSSFQRVCAHPEGAKIVLRMMRVLVNGGTAEEFGNEFNKLSAIYDEIFDRRVDPPQFPHILGEIFSD